MKILEKLLQTDYYDLESVENVLIELDDYIFQLEKIKAEIESYMMLAETEGDNEDELIDAWNYLLKLIKQKRSM